MGGWVSEWVGGCWKGGREGGRKGPHSRHIPIFSYVLQASWDSCEVGLICSHFMDEKIKAQRGWTDPRRSHIQLVVELGHDSAACFDSDFFSWFRSRQASTSANTSPMTAAANSLSAAWCWILVLSLRKQMVPGHYLTFPVPPFLQRDNGNSDSTNIRADEKLRWLNVHKVLRKCPAVTSAGEC